MRSGYGPSMRSAGQVPLAKPRQGLTVLARPALAGPTPESARDAGIMRGQQPVLCAQLMAMSQAQRAVTAGRVVRDYFAHLIFQPSRAHMQNVAVALQAQCWEAQMGRKYPVPLGPAAESGEGGNATQPAVVYGRANVGPQGTNVTAQADPGFQNATPMQQGTAQNAGQPLAYARDGGSFMVTSAIATDEPEFRAYGEQVVAEMERAGRYQDACLRVGQAAPENAFATALDEVDRYLAWLDPELLDIVRGARNDVTNRDRNFLNFRIGNDRYGSRGPWNARTWLLNVRDRAARRLADLCGRRAPPVVTYSVRPIVLWQPPVFFRRPPPRQPAPPPAPPPAPAPAPSIVPAQGARRR